MAHFMVFYELHVNRQLRRERVFHDRTNPMELFDEHDFYERFRFTKAGVTYLCNLLQDDLSPVCSRSHAISLPMKICTALRFCATGSFQMLVGDTNSISQPSVSRIVNQFITAMAGKTENFIIFPRMNFEITRLKQGFYGISSFPNVIGAIDGTHIRILAPHIGEEAYVNRKGYHSINVQMVMNQDYVITNLVVQWPGSTHDSQILRMSNLWDLFEAGEIPSGLLLGDSGYPNKNWLLTPFQNPQNASERRYNRYVCSQ